jgi:hypothetical protein
VFFYGFLFARNFNPSIRFLTHKGQTHGPERDLVRNLLLVTPLRNRFYIDSFTADLTSTLE